MRKLQIALCILLAAGSRMAAAADDNPSYLELTGRYFDVIRVVEAAYAKGEAPSASTLGPLCMAYGKVKRYSDLFDCAAKLDARVAAGDHRIKHVWFTVSDANATPVPEMLRAEAYLELGDYEKSVEAGNRALKLVPPGGYDNSLWPPVKYRLTILANLAVAAALAGKEKAAAEGISALQDVSVPFIGGSNWAPVKRNGLARSYMATRQYAKVLDELSGYGFADFAMGLSDALSKIAWVNPNDSIKTIFELPKLFMMGKAQLETGAKDDAKENFDKILAHPRIHDVGDIHWITLYERGRIAFAEKDYPAAIEFWKRAIELIEAQRSTLNTEANKIGFAGDKQSVYQMLIETLIATGRATDAFAYLERSKSRALVDILAKQERFAAPGMEAAKVEALLAGTTKSELANASLFVQPGGVAPGERRSISAASARQSLAAVPAELASLVSVTATPVSDIQSQLAPDEALVEYYYSATKIHAFVLTKDSLTVATGDKGTLEADIHELRKAVERPGSDAYLPAARRLWAQLVPAMERSGKQHVIVVAHGLLHYLPFAALHDGKSFLVDRYALRFLPSASVLNYLRREKIARPAGILAFGNPDLGDPRMDLKFAEQEALAVVKTVPRSKALVRSEATESALREYASGFQYLHFATHGQFDAQQPLQSALLLSRDPQGGGLLTVAKLYSMRLDADLVVLSACQTGLGKVANGDDVIGLTRGFLYAGAASIVASLWEVEDEATSALMTGFYEKLGQGDKRAALRDAQVDVRRRFPHPFFWAAFQLTGNAR